MELSSRREDLVRRLQLAYSGERGAAIAYVGHARSLRGRPEQADVRRIEAEERDHRDCMGQMLAELGAGPDRWLELRNRLIGTTIACYCQVGGWFSPMYGAGRFERKNIVEYELLARAAALCGQDQFIERLLVMAEIEWDHEEFFRLKAASHGLSRLLPPWKPPPPRDEIRASFQRFLEERTRPATANVV